MADPRLEILRETVAEADHLQLLDRLDRARVVIVGDRTSAHLSLAIANLIARLLPGVTLDLPSVEVRIAPLGSGSLREIGRALVGRVAIGVPAIHSADPIVIDTIGRGPAFLHVTADCWSMRLSKEPLSRLVGVGPATAAAAAIAAAEIFRRVLPEIPGVRLSGQREWNLIDYQTRVANQDVVVAPIDFRLFGAGSVGSSLVYTLLLSGASGSIDVVDDDVLVSRNRVRNPAMVDDPTGSKAVWLAALVAGSGLTAVGHHMTTAEWVSGNGQPTRLAVAAVDTPEGRRQAADALARTTYNAGIDGMKLHVSRHRFADGFACVYCPYVDVRPAADNADVLAEATRLPRQRIVELLEGDRLTSSDVKHMIETRRLADTDTGLVGARLADAVRGRLYAQAGVATDSGEVAVAAPFVPALAGAVLAAEVLKASATDEGLLDRRVDVDLSGYPTGYVSAPTADESGRCLCHSAIRVQKWREAWEGK